MPGQAPNMRCRVRSATGVVAASALAWSTHRARQRSVSEMEQRVFRSINNRTDRAYPAVWAVMQSGSLAAVMAATVWVTRRHDRCDAAVVGVVGTAVWRGVKLIKPAVGRGRPSVHLDDVRVRGAPQTGLGFPSGHAAVAMTLALLLPATGGVRSVALALAGSTAAARLYVGAHLPLDVVGGAAFGALAAAATGHVRQAVTAHASA